MSYFLENEEVEKVEEVKEQDGIASIEPLLDNRIVRAIREMGFEKLSPIQEQAIPYLLQGEDIIGQAQTGTGKTAAFGIPAIQHINPDVKKLQTIILCPTRELAIQAAEELRKIAKYMHGIKVLPVYGGQDISRQIAGLRGVQIIVGTPGRVMDHMRRHTIKLDLVNMVVLDEADEMLNMGFREDMELILGQIPGEHQTALFSATMPKPILEITDRFQKDAKLVKVAAKELTIPLVSQKFYRVKNQDKEAASARLLEYYQPKLTLIFCNTKKKVDELADLLKQQGFQAEGLHGDLSQAQRDVAMNRFRNGGASILIATDVAARGIDVDDVEAVINYDIPQDIEYYVHRIGRTGRAGRKGRSFTFANSREIGKIREIERVCHTTITLRGIFGNEKKKYLVELALLVAGILGVGVAFFYKYTFLPGGYVLARLTHTGEFGYQNRMIKDAVARYSLFGNRTFLMQGTGSDGEYLLGNIFCYFGIIAGVLVVAAFVWFLIHALRQSLLQGNRMGFLLGMACSIGLIVRVMVIYIMVNFGYGVIYTVAVPFFSTNVILAAVNGIYVGLLFCVLRNKMILKEPRSEKKNVTV